MYSEEQQERSWIAVADVFGGSDNAWEDYPGNRWMPAQITLRKVWRPAPGYLVTPRPVLVHCRCIYILCGFGPSGPLLNSKYSHPGAAKHSYLNVPAESAPNPR